MIFAILAMMAMIVTPQMFSLYTDWKLKEEIYKLKSNIFYTQQLAINEARNKTIIFPGQFDSNKSFYRICNGSSNCDEELEYVTIDNAFEIHIFSFMPSTSLDITDYGEIYANILGNISIRDTASGKQACLSVTRMGKVEVLPVTACGT